MSNFQTLDIDMIITHLYIDNLYTFLDATLDLTYPRQLTNSSIDNQCLPNRAKFLVKRVCVLSGANASGKTSLGRLLFSFQSLLAKPTVLVYELGKCRYDKTKPMTLSVEFVTLTDEPVLHSLTLKDDKFSYQNSRIAKNDTVYLARKKLKQSKPYALDWFGLEELITPYLNQGWYYLFSENADEHSGFDEMNLNVAVMKAILQTFDGSISDVLLSQDDKGVNGFSIHFDNNDVVLVDKHRQATGLNRLSRGTYDAIKVAHMVSWLMSDALTDKGSSIYFLDEKMAFSHSELEQAILNLMIEKLPHHAQLFYTTHNHDILEMNLPVHNYVFLVKQKGTSQFLQPETIFKKNDRKLLSYVKNNLFKVLPDTSKIDELL